MLHYLKKFSNWLLPRTCVFCKNLSYRHQDLCQPCLQDLPILPQGCVRCANILSTPQKNLTCGQCLKKSPPFDCSHVLFAYRAPIPKLILNLKFHHTLIHAKLLGELFAEKIQSDWYRDKPLPTTIIPMPLHAKRLTERGFNQAVEIARPISKILGLPLLIHDFQRKKPTLAQATLPALKRQQNLRNAFLIKRNLEQQHVAVIDDVITTGSTIYEFCRALKKQGAGRIDVWCCARP